MFVTGGTNTNIVIPGMKNTSGCTVPTHWVTDARKEIDMARKYGLNSLDACLQTVGNTNQNFRKQMAMCEAADELNGAFSIIANPDCSSPNNGNYTYTPQQMVDNYQAFVNRPCTALTSDGKVIFSNFAPEEMGPTQAPGADRWAASAEYWDTFKTLAQATWGRPVHLVCVLNSMAAASAFAGVADAIGPWSYGGDPKIAIRRTLTEVNAARARGQQWRCTGISQNVRHPPENGPWYDNAGGLQAEIESLRVAIRENPDPNSGIQFCTWNDHNEGSQLQATIGHGYGPLEVAAYFIEWLQAQAEPPILVPTLYLAHRPHLKGVTTFGSGQTILMTQRAISDPTAVVDVLYGHAFLPRPMTVELTSNGVTSSFLAQAGITTFSRPLNNGIQSGRLIETATGAVVATVTSAHQVRSNPESQDFQYRIASSLSGNQGMTPDPINIP
jgi:hypothetical protein